MHNISSWVFCKCLYDVVVQVQLSVIGWQELGSLGGKNDTAGEGGGQRGREEPQKSQHWSAETALRP